MPWHQVCSRVWEQSPLLGHGPASFDYSTGRGGQAHNLYGQVLSELGRGGLFDRIDAWFWRQEQKELEAWLAQSRSVFELERRIRDIGQGAGMRYW